MLRITRNDISHVCFLDVGMKRGFDLKLYLAWITSRVSHWVGIHRPKPTIVLSGFILTGFALISFPSWAGQAVLNWNPNTETDLAGYTAYYGTASGSYTNSVDVGLTDSPTAPSYTIANLTEGNTYYFTVTAYDEVGNESSFSNEVFKTIEMVPDQDITPPHDITNFQAKPGDGQILLSWKNPPDLDFQGLQMRYRTDGQVPQDLEDGELVADVTGLPLAEQLYLHVGLINETPYYYSAFTYDSSGNYSRTPQTPSILEPDNEEVEEDFIEEFFGCGIIKDTNESGRGGPTSWPLDFLLLCAIMLWLGLRNRIYGRHRTAA